ncbi:MAG: CagE, TrbE, VirB component of type transporter system, conserved region [Bryobacterales bacterium]|nr:CagE, TrbE, VirB component of type transporter system, conserved region [Bryobacterales bacterium]
MRNIHEQEYGVSDLIQPIALVEDGIVALKDGGLLAGWQYAGEQLTPSSGAAIRDRLAALLDHGKGWVVETNAVRLPSTDYPAWGEFPDPVSRVIEAERIQNYTVPGRYYETRYFITLSYFPPSTSAEKAKGWFYESPEARGLADVALEHFRGKLAELEALASFLNPTRLRAEGEFDNLLRFIRLCITGEDRPFLKPDLPVDLDFLLGSVDLTGGTKPRLDGKPVRVLAIDPLPHGIYPGMLARLEGLPMSLRLHGRSVLLDRSEAAEMHEFNRRRHGARVTPFISKVLKTQSGNINERAAQLAADANIARSLTDDRSESWAHYSARVILVRDTEQEVEEAVKIVQACAEEGHLKARVETFNVNDALFGSFPGHAFFDVRQVPIRAFNIAGMSPLHSTWRGHHYHPSAKMPSRSSPLLVATAEGMTPYRHHLHIQDVGHTVVFGPTGNGKTTAYGLHAVSLLRYPKAQVVMFDRNRTQYVLCKAVGGKFYDFCADKSLQLCPLQVLDTPADLAWATNYVGGLCEMAGLTLTSTHIDRIGKTLERFARGKYRSLTNFAGSVGDLDIQAALQLYTIGNPVSARLLDGESDSISDSHFTVFEMAELMQMNKRISVAVQMYLFRRIERKLNPSHITGIFLDEARRMIGDDLFAGAIENWLKEIRNLNGFVMLALQEIEDGHGSKLRSVIEQQCKNKIFLPNRYAQSASTRQAYTELGLDDSQIDQIVHSRPKSDYFVWGEQWSKITFDIEKVALAFISANDPKERELVDRLSAANPEGWRADYLRARGLHEWAEYMEQLQEEK